MTKKRIYRSTESKIIAGVCGGLGDYFDIDPTWIRILCVLSIFANGIGLIAYVIWWIVVPQQPLPVFVATDAGSADSGAPPLQAELAGHAAAKDKQGAGFWPGIVLISLGLIFLFNRLFFWIDFAHIWPILLIGLGAVLIYRAARPHPSREEATVSEASKVSDVQEGEVVDGSK